LIQFVSNLPNVMAAINRNAEQRVFGAANELRNAWINRLSGERHGRTYRVPGTNRTYVASAPGESPAVQTGDLRRSVTVNPPVWIDGTISSEVGSKLEKAPMLEFGTRNMQARPSLAPARDDALPVITQLIEAVWF
jgi:hypothetical protein